MIRCAAVPILAGLLAMASVAGAKTPAETAALAREAYDQGRFQDAAEGYARLVDQGLESAALYYNLANAEYKAGRLGRAVAFYRRALIRAPHDGDIRHNLNFARQRVQRPEVENRPVAKLAGRIFTFFTWRSLAMAALGCYLTAFILAAFLLLGRGRPAWLAWVTGLVFTLFIVSAGWASARLLHARLNPWGVVTAQQAEARSGPGEIFSARFTVPEGREVKIFNREGKWVEIGLPEEGYKGWVKQDRILADQ